MKKFRGMALKKLTGVLLILLAIAMLVFWEAKGREVVMMDEVLIAAEDISEAETITPSMLTSVSVPLNAKVSGGIYAARSKDIVGLEAVASIPKGAQISAKSLRRVHADDENEEAYFVIKHEWIFMCSSALRQGDEVEIVPAAGGQSFGNFKVAFVKDKNNDEVAKVALESTGLGGNGLNARTDNGSGVDHVEIVTDLDGYMRLKTFAEAADEPALILVQRRN